MKHRGVEYTIVQGIGRHIWKWSVAFDADHSEASRAATKAEAISEAERAIDRALAPSAAQTLGLTDAVAVPVSAPRRSQGGCTPSARRASELRFRGVHFFAGML